MQLPVKFYKQFLDCPNIIYGITKIKKLKYKKLDVFVPSIRGLSAIAKTMIFIDSINKRIILTDYFCIKLPGNLKDKAN